MSLGRCFLRGLAAWKNPCHLVSSAPSSSMGLFKVSAQCCRGTDQLFSGLGQMAVKPRADYGRYIKK